MNTEADAPENALVSQAGTIGGRFGRDQRQALRLDERCDRADFGMITVAGIPERAEYEITFDQLG